MVLLLILTVPDEALTPRSRTVLCKARAKLRKAVFPCPGGTKKRRKASFHGPLPAPRRCRAGQRKNDTRVSGSPQTFRRAAKTMNTQPGIPALRGKHGKPAPRLRRPSDGRKQTGQGRLPRRCRHAKPRAADAGHMRSREKAPAPPPLSAELSSAPHATVRPFPGENKKMTPPRHLPTAARTPNVSNLSDSLPRTSTDTDGCPPPLPRRARERSEISRDAGRQDALVSC